MECRKCRTPNPENATFCSVCGIPMGHRDSAISEAMGTPYAGFWRRFVALVIDSIILTLGAFVLGLVFGFTVAASLGPASSSLMRIDLVGRLLGITMYWLYFTLFESSSMRATPGKMVLGIVVVDSRGHRISFARANGRYWSKLVSAFTFGIGYLAAGFTRKKQALHDLMADTFVVKKSEQKTEEVNTVSPTQAPHVARVPSTFRTREEYLQWRAAKMGSGSESLAPEKQAYDVSDIYVKLPYEPLELRE
jgi:uncharacterized RDD family membrane protein YckC